MKRIVFVFSIMLAFITNVQALQPYVESGNGPVKQITVTLRTDDGILYYGNVAGGTTANVVIWYDSIGRMAEHADYMGGMIAEGYVCQYHGDSVCAQYDYDNGGLLEGSFNLIRYDASGRQVSSRRYLDGAFVFADSMVYNALGQKVEQYETPYKKDSLSLKYVYSYDSAGRLSKVVDVIYGQDNSYTMEYLSNGNYMEHHMNKNGQKWQRKFFVDNKGRLVKKEDKNTTVRYSKFDRYGNWLVAESSSHQNSAVTITERIIDYYE